MTRARDFLRANQNGDGGWGYKPGGMSFVEPTAAVILALSPDAQAAAEVQRARAFLESLQRVDGGWGIAAMDDGSGWMTAWAVWALAESAPEAAGRGVEWLLQTAGKRSADTKEVADAQRVLQIDASLTGWPWQPGDAAWTFPTALSLMALNAAGIKDTPRATEGINFLLDRSIATGGWNIGNPFMVSGNLPPTVEGTTLALMALGAYGVDNAVTQRAEEWLAQDGFTNTAFEWAWRAWYWKQRGKPLEGADAALAALEKSEGGFDNNPFTNALAVLGEAGESE